MIGTPRQAPETQHYSPPQTPHVRNNATMARQQYSRSSNCHQVASPIQQYQAPRVVREHLMRSFLENRTQGVAIGLVVEFVCTTGQHYAAAW